ncbi:MAG: hypothetical protein E2O54_16250 [Gammaproteobacteria bacterium]|nr:MAG: hypothetical protein E2O54_16250 [Gammaproteobacteria bacterium]TDJ53738.1 MAG: hypothetical protein E2O47_07430 [Gemmatimonadota bacterium]
MTVKILTLALVGCFLAATGCAAPGKPGPIASTVAGGVVVVFGNVGSVASPKYCPLSVVRTDNECDLEDFIGSGKPADYVCRYPEDKPGKSPDQRRVFWSSATATGPRKPTPTLKFNIKFKNDKPCQNNLGAGEAPTKLCNAKKAKQMTFIEDEARFKYDVTSSDCEVLDPYIVFR